MTILVLSLHDQATELSYPQKLDACITKLFGAQRGNAKPRRHISITESGADRYSITGDVKEKREALPQPALIDALLDEVVHSLIERLGTAVALHAACVAWRGKSVLIAGSTGAGKTSLAGWLAAKGFEFLSDELVVADKSGSTVTFPRPLLAKPGADELISILRQDCGAETVATARNTVICLKARAAPAPPAHKAGLIIFPRFTPGGELALTPLSPAMVGVKLMGCNLNARNLDDHGLSILAALSRNVPALGLTYGGFAQLDGVADTLVRLVLEQQADAAFWHKLGSAFRGRAMPDKGDGTACTESSAFAGDEPYGVSRELAAFLADCRAALAGDSPAQGLEQVALRLKQLIADPRFRSFYFGETVMPGNRAIHEDPGRALRFLTHILPAAYVSTPHDHGNFWVIYAQVAEHSDVTEWRRLEAAADIASPDAFAPIKQYRLNSGDVQVFPRGAIHSIDCPPGTRYVRLMGQDIAGEGAGRRR